MRYDLPVTSDPPSLEEFKNMLVSQLLMSAFWQNVEKLEINMLNIPIIMGNSLLRKQENSDRLKVILTNHTSNSIFFRPCYPKFYFKHGWLFVNLFVQLPRNYILICRNTFALQPC